MLKNKRTRFRISSSRFLNGIFTLIMVNFEHQFSIFLRKKKLSQNQKITF